MPKVRSRLFTLLAVFLSNCPLAQAIDVPANLAVGAVATSTGTDPNGEYWQRPPVSILGDGATNRAKGIDRQIRNFGPPTGAFRATRLSYTGNDLTVVVNWLATDGPSFVGVQGNLDDGAFRFTGYINVATPGIIRLGTASDDGSRISIGGLDIVNNDGSHGEQTVDVDVGFEAAGLYPIEITYFNGDWTSDNSPDGSPAGVNHSGNPDPSVHGGANFHLRVGGATVTASQMAMFHGCTPPPAGLVGWRILAYVRFRSLTDSSFTLTFEATPGPGKNFRGPINGMQIVAHTAFTVEVNRLANGNVRFSWDGPGQLQSTDELRGHGAPTVWTNVPSANVSPVTTVPEGTRRFFRVRR